MDDEDFFLPHSRPLWEKTKQKQKQLVRKETLHPGTSNRLLEPHKQCSFIEKRLMPKDLLDLFALLTAHHITVAGVVLTDCDKLDPGGRKKVFLCVPY